MKRPNDRRELQAGDQLRLDGTSKRYRFASLAVPIDAEALKAKPDGAATGVYVVEQGPDTYWLIGYWWWGAGFRPANATTTEVPPTEPPWLDYDDQHLPRCHAAMHNHGHARDARASRGGRWVVLQEDGHNSRTEPDSLEHDYANDRGVCEKRCPPLRPATTSPGAARSCCGGPRTSIAKELTDVMSGALDGYAGVPVPGPEVDRVVTIPAMPRGSVSP